MAKILLLSTTRWNPIIQMSDGVKNKFKRVDGRPLQKGKNIYFFQQEFYEMLKDESLSVIHRGRSQTNHKIINENLIYAQGFKGTKYLSNKKDPYTYTLYRIREFIDVEYNGKVRTVIVAEDLTDTTEEFHLTELWNTDTDAFKTIDMGWKSSWQ